MRLTTAIRALLFGGATAANLALTIPPAAILPNPAASLLASTHATLHSSGAPFSAPLRRDGTFAFRDVLPGSYLLSVHSRDYVFENLRVDVEVEGEKEKVRAWQTFRGNEWANRGEKRGESAASAGGRAELEGVEVRIVAGKEYYLERQGCE